MIRQTKDILRVVFSVLFDFLILIVVLPYLFPLSAQGMNSKNRPFPESEFAMMYKTLIHYRCFSVKENSKGNVLLIHGFSGSTFSWRKNFSALQDGGYNVLAIDMPAFGYSAKDDEANYTDSIKNDLIAEVIKRVTKSKPEFNLHANWHVVGHSMGAMTVASFATEYPELIASITLVDGSYTNFLGNKSNMKRFTSSFLRLPFILQWSEVILQYGFYKEKRFKTLLSSAYGTDADREAVQGYMNPFAIEGSASAILRMASKVGFAKIDDSVLQRFPMMLIWGTEDQWISIEAGKKFLTLHPNCNSVFINGSGHCPMETHAREFNSSLLQFINR